ncbi:S1C family serine protease [Saccharopolyspora elongata]|uniref:PDZ domain-containing protein n=1 Tax=Saccharopolyspora elongata TaxID=2530387 RepID=A0A4R4ZA79_9PSEU|nr:trypsin-like peptidase domain-containing protein [Saccharopolyspora elongata]TDD55218.1 PDZ domain-containing protein [Saccharopolyspora elongata]
MLLVWLLVISSGCTAAPHDATPPSPQQEPQSTELPAVVERAAPAVVTVSAGQSTGSGVTYRDNIVLTNAHVVGESSQVEITFADATRTPGQVLATDIVTDLAVVRTERTGLPPIHYRQELPLPGETVIAIGSPLGFENTVTAGIVSGLHREIPGSARQTQALVDLIQTDASISPGNSGGALLNTRGEVVGINNAYIRPITGATSIGFAIPTSTAVDVADQLLEHGRAVHPYLGVSLGQVTPAIDTALGLPVDHGAIVLSVDPRGPSEAAGIQPGDVIVTFADRPVRTVEDLLALMRGVEPDQRVQMTVIRQNQEKQLAITIGENPG